MAPPHPAASCGVASTGVRHAKPVTWQVFAADTCQVSVDARLHRMHALKTQVKNGRVIVDEPTDLPDGAEVEVLVIGGDELTADERAELHASLDRALDDSDAGRGVDAWEYLKQYRARRESRPSR